MAAIYQPPIPSAYWLTTTPYPVEYAEGLVVGCAPVQGRLTLVPSDSMESTFAPLSMTYVQTRWFMEDGPYDDAVESTFGPVNMTYVQTRWFLEDGPYDDAMESTFNPINMTYRRIKVEADTPDEQLYIGIEILNTCRMDAV